MLKFNLIIFDKNVIIEINNVKYILYIYIITLFKKKKKKKKF